METKQTVLDTNPGAVHTDPKLYVVGLKLAPIAKVSQFADFTSPKVKRYKYISQRFFLECLRELKAQEQVELIDEAHVKEKVIEMSRNSGRNFGSFSMKSVCTFAPVFFQVELRKAMVVGNGTKVDPKDLDFTTISVIKDDGKIPGYSCLGVDDSIVKTVKTITDRVSPYEGRYPKHTSELRERYILGNIALGILTVGVAHAIFYLACLIYRMIKGKWLPEKDPISFFKRVHLENKMAASQVDGNVARLQA